MIRRVRLVTGLVLFAYVASHLFNHALGLVSVAAMDSGREWFLWVWRNPVGTAALYGSMLAHLGLALWALYLRRGLRMPALEALQLAFGLSILPLLAIHVVGTRLGSEWFGFNDTYTPVLLNLWKTRTDLGWRQALLLAIVWTHGCIGLHLWLRLKRGYSRIAPSLAALAVLVPVLALLGFVEGGREVLRAADTPGWTARALAEAHSPNGLERAVLERAVENILLAFGAGVVLTLFARLLRQAYESRGAAVRIRYPDGRIVAVPIGYSVLETSRVAAIAHASVCNGRGRCSTCRVRVVRGLQSQPLASSDERAVLKRVGAAPNVRLACQLRPTHDLSVVPLLPVASTARGGLAQPEHIVGKEQEVCVLFADLRGFTRLSERKMPYDVVFYLNRYFETMSRAIEQSGGIPVQFSGDGIMALFGVESGPARGCRDAVAAAGAMARALSALSFELAEELGAPLRMGIGINDGPAVVGHMGHGAAMGLTAVGDTVNVASRLQDLTKQYRCQLIISETAAQRAGIAVADFPRHELTVRNRTEPVVIRAIEALRSLAMRPAAEGMA